MKERIGLSIAGVSLLLICSLVCVGCTPSIVEIPVEVDSGSALMQPTFCTYQGRYSQERFDIKGITVSKVTRAPDQKKRWQLDAPWEDRQTVWHLEYKASDNFMKRLSTSPVPCLTYGKTPPGYQEDVKAVPLEPEQFYSVWIRGDNGAPSEALNFIIRLDESGTPERLEYHQKTFLIRLIYTTKPRDALRLY